jgi:hypothetical protein
MIEMIISLIALFFSCMALVGVSILHSSTSIIQKGDNNEARIDWKESK